MPRRPRSKDSVYHENTARAGSAVSSCLHAAANESSADEESHHLADLDAAIDNAIKQSKDGLASLETLLKMKLEIIARRRPTTTSPKGRKKAPEPTLQLTSVVPKTLPLPLTSKELLSCGLSYAGFSIQRQGNVRLETNIERFKGFYGLEPRTLLPVFTDVKDRFPAVNSKHLMMTMNWLTLYDKYVVLSGRWGYILTSYVV